MQPRFASISFLFIGLFISTSLYCQNSESVQKLFDAGADLMEQSRFREALERFQAGLALSPDDTSMLYNAGLAAFSCGNFEASVKHWQRVKTLDPADWQVRAKLIQAYQALGDVAKRDSERSAVLEIRKRGDIPELTEARQYCREQFDAAGERLMVFEHFDLVGDRAVRYVFIVLKPNGKEEKFHLSLGSYESTNAVWRQATKPTPKPGERLFHLDGYYEWGHATYGMMSPEPSYDTVRAAVVDILNGRTKPASQTVHGRK